jgi:hypothetical protein
MAQEAVVTYPEGVPQLLKMSDSEFAKELAFLARVGVPAINLRDKELAYEIAAAKELAAVPSPADEVDA